MPRGDLVLIRSQEGAPGLRRIWDDSKDRLFACHEEYWGRWERQKLEPVCAPVDRSQVYHNDAALAAQIEAAWDAMKRGDAAAKARVDALWKQARPWQ
jgi:hypothetical protein